jgi:hypothetical protein
MQRATVETIRSQHTQPATFLDVLGVAFIVLKQKGDFR